MSSTKGRLTKRDLAVVQNYLVEMKKKWFDIGIQLDLDPEELEKLLMEDKYTNNDRLRKMLLIWLLGQQPIPTWRALCAALRTPTVNEPRVAGIVERERVFLDLEMSGASPEEVLLDALSMKKAISVSGQTSQEFAKTTPNKKKTSLSMDPTLDACEQQPVPSVTADAGSIREDKTSPSPVMEDTEDARELNISYATPTVAQSPFPYLITSGLSVEEKESLTERLMIESADIRLKFCSLASNFHGSLLLRNVDIAKLNDEVRNFHPYYYERIYKYRATDITTAMGLLHNNLNFQFYDILSHLIAKLGVADDKQALQSYQNTHAEFSKRRLFECPTGVFGGSRWEYEEEMIVKKTNRDKSINDVTLADLSVFVEQLRKEIKVDEFSMRLLGVAVEEGSTLLYFALDMSLVNSDATFPLSHELKLRLIDMGVWLVSCGEFIFQHKPKELEEVDGEDDVESVLGVTSLEVSGVANVKDLATLGLRECMSYEDEDIGSYTDLACNNIRQVVEVSNSATSNGATPYKSYKIGCYKRGSLEWVSGMKGIRYGIGRCPKVALNDEGYVIEVDEEEDGKISFRVGIIHHSNVMLWTEAMATNITGTDPCIAVSNKTVVMAFLRDSDAYYCTGSLDTGSRTVKWHSAERKFLTGGTKGLSLAINSNLEVGIAYSKSSMSALVNPLYMIVGKLANEKITFSSDRGSSQSLAPIGWYPSLAIKSDGSALVVYSQHKSVPYKRIKYSIGKVEKSNKGSGFKVRWGVNPGEDCFEFVGERAAMATNEKGLVVISHAHNQKYTCHIGKLFQETVI